MENKRGLRMVIIVSALMFVMLFTLLGTGVVQAQTSAIRTVKVGWWTDLTGPLADSVGTQLKGGQDYFKYVNEEEGGIKGKGGVVKVEMLWVDHKCNPTIALEAYARWRTDPNLVIVQDCLASIVMAAEDKLKADKIPCLYHAGTLQVVMEPIRDYVYMTGFPRDMIIAGAVDWFLGNWKEKKPPKFAMISCDQGWAKHCMFEGGGAKYAKARGVEVVQQVVVPTFPTDTTSELRKIKEAGANFIYGNFCPMTAAIVLKDAYRMGLNIPIILDQCNQGPEIIGLLKEAGEGVYVTPTVMPFEGLAEEFMTPGLKKAAMIHAKYNPGKRVADAPNYMMGLRQAIAIGEIMRLTLEKVSAKDLNGEALKKYGIDAMKDFDCWGLNGPMYFPTDTHIGQHSWLMVQQKGGKLYPVVKWQEAPFVTDTKLIKSSHLKPGTWKELLGK